MRKKILHRIEEATTLLRRALTSDYFGSQLFHNLCRHHWRHARCVSHRVKLNQICADHPSWDGLNGVDGLSHREAAAFSVGHAWCHAWFDYVHIEWDVHRGGGGDILGQDGATVTAVGGKVFGMQHVNLKICNICKNKNPTNVGMSNTPCI